MNRQRSPALDFCRFEFPSVNAVHRGRVGRRHAPNGVANRAFAGNIEAHAAVDGFVLYIRSERHIVHVDKMLPKRVDIDLGPVGLGVSYENLDNLLYRGERALSGLGGDSAAGLLPVHHMLALHHMPPRRHRLPGRHHVLPMHHVMAGSHARERLQIRLCERDGGYEASDQSKGADHGSLLR